MKYPVIVHKSKYGYDVRCPILPGCYSQGDTLKDALKNIEDAIRVYLGMDASESNHSKLYQVEVGV